MHRCNREALSRHGIPDATDAFSVHAAQRTTSVGQDAVIHVGAAGRFNTFPDRFLMKLSDS